MFSSRHTTVCWWISKRVKRFESYLSPLYILSVCVCDQPCVWVSISRFHISVPHKLWYVTPFLQLRYLCVCACARSWWRTCWTPCRGCSHTHERLRALWDRLCRRHINSCAQQEAECLCFRPSCPLSALDSCSHGKTPTSDPAPR